MSAPSLILGFGDPGPLLQKSLAGGAYHYVPLPGDFAGLAKPQPDVWKTLSRILSESEPELVIWGQNALILQDRLDRALAVNHQPDFLWPLSLELQGGAVTPSETDLFLAIGGFEISLFGFDALRGFHHAARGRALAKLLAVSDIETMTIADYLHQSWMNFESVKAPDPWLIAGDESLALSGLGEASVAFKAQHSQWQMGRAALEARSRNTLAAADIARSNLEVMQPRMGELMRRLPYHGFWPVKAGKTWLTLPCSGHHPVAQSLIWRGAYCGKAIDLWNALFCQGAYETVTDARGDGHLFGLLFAAQRPGAAVTCASPSLDSAALAQAAAEANDLKIVIELAKARQDDGIAVIDESDESLWGKMDLFIPFDTNAQHVQNRVIPDGYAAFLCDEDKLAVNQVTDLSSIKSASALMLIRADRAQKILSGGRA